MTSCELAVKVILSKFSNELAQIMTAYDFLLANQVILRNV